MKIPRIMIAAPKSGSGKTMITCALLGAFRSRQLDIISCKCGPDYIDPMFHRTMLGIPAENLDTYFTGEEQTRRLLAEFGDSHDLVVMEGVMGLYDGIGGIREEGSSYHLAKVTKTPIILVIDVHGMGRSMIPVLAGILSYDREHLIRGIILNRISKSFYNSTLPLLSEELSVPIVGYMENHSELIVDSRHLGLRLPDEMHDIEDRLTRAAEYLQQTVDVNRILAIARSAEEFPALEREEGEQCENIVSGEAVGQPVTLAVARDEAFCFYYEENLRMLKKAGVKLDYFSPLHDERLPDEIQGILLGGGYPELYAEALSRNVSMRASIKEAIEGGIPSLAECGGFMYLQKTLTDEQGNTYPMAGVIDGTTYYTGKMVRFGYVELTAGSGVKDANVWCERIKGHEFHYYDSTNCGEAIQAVKPIGNRSWSCCHVGKEHWWGFPHLYYPSCPEFVKHFVEEMMKAKLNML